MTQIRRILCAIDLSPALMPAWETAQRLARVTDASLVLLHVVPVPWMPAMAEGAFVDPGTYQRLIEGNRLDALERLDQLVRDAGGVQPRVTSRVEDGAAAQQILSVSEREAADLVVVGTHGRTGLNRLLMGSVAEKVLQLSTRPVVTVRPKVGGGSKRGLTRILYPTDFSPAAQHAWPWARTLAEAAGAEVDVLHVLLAVVPDRHLDPAALDRLEKVIRETAQASADRFLADCGLAPDRIRLHLVHGVEDGQIVHWAGSRDADLIVMGTHGRTGILRVALGSVTRRVLHSAPCPVLTVSPEVRG